MMVKLAGFTVFSLVILMIIPVYADVDIIEISPETFEIDQSFTISGTISDSENILLTSVIRGPNGEKPPNKNTFSSNGIYKFIPINAGNVFVSKGEYTISVFTDKQDFATASVIKMYYEKGTATLLPDYILELTNIGNQGVNETKELTFTASVTDSTITVIEYSLSNQPSGATINEDTGVFTWTPTDIQSGSHIFDIVVTSGPLEDRETITVIVLDKPEPIAEPEPLKEPEPKQTTEEQTTEEQTTEELGLASFVDETKDPQSYVDRYENEASYKKWFDDNYSEYSSIYQAVGLEAPLEIPASFVDETKEPQSYVDRYENEASYKEWFDDNYSEYSSIYQAVGLEAPEVVEPEVKVKKFGICGTGTKLIEGVCTVIEKPNVKPWWQFW